MDYMELYNTNEDFREYVDKYKRSRKLSLEEALEHELVKQYAKYVAEKNN